jgi:hypothetical protein
LATLLLREEGLDMYRAVAVAVMALVAVAPVCAAGKPALRGAFLEVTNDYSAGQWTAAVKEMHALHMKLVIIQTESYLTGTTRNPVLETNIVAVLDAAAKANMKVWIGLVLPENGNGSELMADDDAFVRDVITASEMSIARIATKFANHAAFDGWYLPLELWTPGPKGLGKLPTYVDEVSALCKAAKVKTIAISPFISPLAEKPEATTSAFAGILKQSDVSVVLLQDGVGARNVEPRDFPEKVTPYVSAMKAAVDDARGVGPDIEFWINAESFQTLNPGTANQKRVPAPLGRFPKQLELAGQDVVTYEYYNFLSPNGPGKDAAKNLVDEYKAWLNP